MPRATRKAAAPVRPVVNTFYVVDRSTKHLGGAVVQDSGGDRIIAMTDAQAQYWLDQGVISVTPLGQHSEGSRDALMKMNRARE